MTDLGAPITRVVCRRQSKAVQRPPVFSSQRRLSSGLTASAVEASPSGHPTAEGQSLPAPSFRAFQHDACDTRLAARRRRRGSGTARVESRAGGQNESESRIGAFVGPNITVSSRCASPCSHHRPRPSGFFLRAVSMPPSPHHPPQAHTAPLI